MKIIARVCLPFSAVGGQTTHAHISCGVICLANISNDAVDRREKNEEIELCVVENAIKVYAPEHLWSNNICDLVKCHISERDISENHSAVKDAGNRWKRRSDPAVNGLECCLVRHVASRTGTVRQGAARTDQGC